MEQSAIPDRRPSWQRDPRWRERGACRDVDPELFFPIGTGWRVQEQVEAAKEVCRGCSVVDTCLAFAVDTGQRDGVWGGLSQDELRPLIRRRRSRSLAVEPDVTEPLTPQRAQAVARQLYRRQQPVPAHVRQLANIAHQDQARAAGRSAAS